MSFRGTKDRVKQTSITTGTGNLTFSGTSTGSVSFSSVYSTNDLFDVGIYATDGSAWEICLAQLVSSTVLARILVYSNSLGTTAFINFTVSTIIYCDLPAIKINVTYANNFSPGAYW
jgi:hypothetical protein